MSDIFKDTSWIVKVNLITRTITYQFYKKVSFHQELKQNIAKIIKNYFINLLPKQLNRFRRNVKFIDVTWKGIF
jgi:uncharacterized radical SAM superfamily Fe-S cluster-containing enzyme